MSGMEKRGGAWTSQTKADDARVIRRLAEAILDRDVDPDTRSDAQRITRLARDLEHELRG